MQIKIKTQIYAAPAVKGLSQCSYYNVGPSRRRGPTLGVDFLRNIMPPPPFNVGISLFRFCVLGQGILLLCASLDSGVNEYLVGQRWQYVREIQPKWLQDCMLSVELKYHTNEQVRKVE